MKVRVPTRRTAAATLIITLGGLIGAVSLPATAASAWPWSGTVTVHGSTGCGPGIQTATVYANLNSEGYRVGTGTGAPPNYSVTFKQVPSGGGWGWFWVECSVTGGHGTWARIYRPTVGSSITVNL